jgi:hypothetical protein
VKAETDAILKRTKEIAHQRYLAFVFLKRAGYKYEELRIKLENNWSSVVNVPGALYMPNECSELTDLFIIWP